MLTVLCATEIKQSKTGSLLQQHEQSLNLLYWEYLSLVSGLFIYMLYTDYEVISFPAEGTTDLPSLVLCYLRSKSHGEMQNVYELSSESSEGKVQLLYDRNFLHIKACNSF